MRGSCPGSEEATINTFYHVAKQNGKEDEGEDDSSLQSAREKRKEKERERERERERELLHIFPLVVRNGVESFYSEGNSSSFSDREHSTCAFAFFLSLSSSLSLFLCRDARSVKIELF